MLWLGTCKNLHRKNKAQMLNFVSAANRVSLVLAQTIIFYGKATNSLAWIKKRIR
jgi:hypothetical protein